MEDNFHLGVKALICNAEGKLLLLKRLKSIKGIWDFPGGRVQKNESLEDALRREVQEEIGLQNITRITPFGMALSDIRLPLENGDAGLIFALYLCEIEGDFSPVLSDEHTEVNWVEPAQAAEMLKTNYPAELTEKLVGLVAVGE